MSRNTRHNLFTAAAQVVTEIVDTTPPAAPADVARLVALRGTPGYTQAVHRYVARHEIVVGLGHAIIGGWPVPGPVRTPKGAGFGYFGWWGR